MTHLSGTSIRVAGHTLIGEGRAHRIDGDPPAAYPPAPSSGRGRCSCGAVSGWLPSGQQRRRWHRHHKAEVLDALVDQTLDSTGTVTP